MLRISALMKKDIKKMYKNKSFIPFSFILIDILSPPPSSVPSLNLKISPFLQDSSFRFFTGSFVPSLPNFPGEITISLTHLLHLLWFDIHPSPPTEVALFRSAVTPECQVWPACFHMFILFHDPRALACVPTYGLLGSSPFA